MDSSIFYEASKDERVDPCGKGNKMDRIPQRKAVGLLFAVGLLAGAVLGIQPQVAYADDGRDAAPQTLAVTEAQPRSAADSAYDFKMSGNGTNGTSGRSKDNDSSSYVYIASITKSCRLYIDGAKGKYGSWANCTVNDHANATRPGRWRIMNYVNERGFGYARLTAWANNGATSLHGVWSPDSVGTYPSINA